MEVHILVKHPTTKFRACLVAVTLENKPNPKDIIEFPNLPKMEVKSVFNHGLSSSVECVIKGKYTAKQCMQVFEKENWNTYGV